MILNVIFTASSKKSGRNETDDFINEVSILSMLVYPLLEEEGGTIISQSKDRIEITMNLTEKKADALVRAWTTMIPTVNKFSEGNPRRAKRQGVRKEEPITVQVTHRDAKQITCEINNIL